MAHLSSASMVCTMAIRSPGLTSPMTQCAAAHEGFDNGMSIGWRLTTLGIACGCCRGANARDEGMDQIRLPAMREIFAFVAGAGSSAGVPALRNRCSHVEWQLFDRSAQESI